jgi:hypothetical protein
MKCSSPPEWKRFSALGMGRYCKPTLCSERKMKERALRKDGAPHGMVREGKDGPDGPSANTASATNLIPILLS